MEQDLIIKELAGSYIQHVTHDIGQHAHDEKYKFDALRHFQSTFDLNAQGLAANLKDALSKVDNLAVGASYYPVASIQAIAENEPDEARRALRILFSEDQPEHDRIAKFQEIMIPLSEKYSYKNVSYPFNMDLRFVSLLLSLQYPEKYMYFKPTEVDTIHQKVYGEKTGTRSNDIDRILKARDLGTRILNVLKELWPNELHNLSTAMGYGGEYNLWFAQDVIWYNARHASNNALLQKIKQFINDNPNWRDNEHWSLTQDQINEAVTEFQVKFSPDKLKQMSDEEILRWMPYREVSTNDGLSYLLEHSPIIGKMGGIGGGSAGKMGYYQGKDGNWKTSLNKITTQEDVLAHRKVDIDVISRMHSFISLDNFTGLREYINSLKADTSDDGKYKAAVPGLVWVRKYFTILLPNKFVELYGNNFVKKLEGVAGLGKINGDGKDPDYSLWYSQMNKIAPFASELGITNYELSRIIWELVSGDQGEKQEMEATPNAKPEDMSLNTIIYGPPGTGKTYSIGQYKRTLLDSQTSKYQGLLRGTVKDTLLFLFSKDNTPRSSGDIWRSEEFQIHQQYNGRTRSNSAAIQLVLSGNNDLFERIEEGPRVKYRATQEGLESARFIAESQNTNTHKGVEDFYEFITFHQSYGYEEFIEGIRAETNDTGAISYAVRDGVFKAFCRRAENDPENNYLFVIDEINRGNISKIFGELITLIEPGKRLGASEALTSTLPYSGEKFGVPKNVYIIGTMNTADRSIALLDIALRRRFDFNEIMPNPLLLSNDIEGVDLRQLLVAINAKIVEVIDRNHQIGHSYLMDVTSLSGLHTAWYQRIIPLLQEYFYDDNSDLRGILKTFVHNDEIVMLHSEEFKQALIGIYEKAQNTNTGI